MTSDTTEPDPVYRIALSLTQSQHDKIRKYIPHGLRSLVMLAAIEALCDRLTSDTSGHIIGAALDNRLKVLIKE